MVPDTNAGNLTVHLGYWLRYVSNHVSQGFARKLQARDVTVAEWVIMSELYQSNGVAPSRLADALGMTRGAITKIAQRLIGKSMISRKSDPTDGRAQTLRLTANGRKLVPKLTALADQNDAEFFDHLSQRDRQTVVRVLQGIVKRHELRTVPVD